MTDLSTRKAPRRPTPIPPWVVYPSTLFVANIVCFPINWWVEGVQYDRRLQFANTCGTFIGISWPVGILVFVLFAVAVASIVLTIIWCRRKRAGGGGWGVIIGTALLLIIFALINIFFVAGDIDYVFYTFHCSGLG